MNRPLILLASLSARSFFMQTRKGWLMGGVAVLLPIPCIAQTALRIDSITLPGNQVQIEVTDDGTNATGYQIQSSSNLVGAFWADVGTVQSRAGAQTTLSITRPAGDSYFFRVVGVVQSTNPDDLDGDGLTNSFEENNNYSDPTKWDTDGDGFSDGVEFAYDTLPRDAGSKPDLTTLPRAEFAEASSSGTEGELGTHDVVISLDKPGASVLRINVLPESTAVAGDDYIALPATVGVTGTSAVIPINWIDDTEVRPIRTLILEIGSDTAYARGGQTRHTVLLGENDAWWSGVLTEKYAQRNFRLKLVRNGSVVGATFAAGAGNDGLPLLEGETPGAESDQSVGVIPAGVYQVTEPVVFTEALFELTSPAMPAATGGLFGAGTGLTRTLELKSMPTTPISADGQEINMDGGRVVGSYTECLAFPGQSACAIQTGTFFLVRGLPGLPSVTP